MAPSFTSKADILPDSALKSRKKGLHGIYNEEEYNQFFMESLRMESSRR